MTSPMGPKPESGLLIAEALMCAMERVEDFSPGTRAWRNRNPLNVWDGLAPGKPKRIWPTIPVDPDDFLIFSTVAEGRKLALEQLNRKISRGLSLRELVGQWAPAADPRNNPKVYADRVQKYLKIPADVPLANFGRII